MSKLTSLGPTDKKHHRLLLPLQPNQLLMLLKLIALLVQLQVTELRVVAPLEVANHPASHHLEHPLTKGCRLCHTTRHKPKKKTTINSPHKLEVYNRYENLEMEVGETSDSNYPDTFSEQK